MPTSEKEIKIYLDNLRVKLSIFGYVFENRPENNKCLAELNYVVKDVIKELESLEVTHFKRGPKFDVIHGSGNIWEFIKVIKKKKVYIKVNSEILNKNVLIISFHF